MDATEEKGLPYGADYAKSGRSTCKNKDCSSKIKQGELRMSVRVKSKMNDEFMDIFFHAECFWSTPHRNMSEGVIRGFEHLRWEDQEKIRGWMYHKTGGEAREFKNARAEYAKTGRSKCVTCKEDIELGALRVSYRSNGFQHPDCLAEKHVYLKLADEMDNYENLEEQDQKTLSSLFTGPNEDDKRKEADTQLDQMPLPDLKEALINTTDGAEIQELKATLKLKKHLKNQTDLIWVAKETINEAMVGSKELRKVSDKKKALKALIELNGGYASGTLDELVQFLADILVFGGFEECPECEATNFFYNAHKHGYQCMGGQSFCGYLASNVPRKPFEVDDDTDVIDLSEYVGKQLLPDGRAYAHSASQLKDA